LSFCDWLNKHQRNSVFYLHAKPVWEVAQSETIKCLTCKMLGERDNNSGSPVSLPVGSLLLANTIILIS